MTPRITKMITISYVLKIMLTDLKRHYAALDSTGSVLHKFIK